MEEDQSNTRTVFPLEHMMSSQQTANMAATNDKQVECGIFCEKKKANQNDLLQIDQGSSISKYIYSIIIYSVMPNKNLSMKQYVCELSIIQLIQSVADIDICISTSRSRLVATASMFM